MFTFFILKKVILDKVVESTKQILDQFVGCISVVPPIKAYYPHYNILLKYNNAVD